MDNKCKKKKKDITLRSKAFDSAYQASASPLPTNVLPTYQDVGLAIEDLKAKGSTEAHAVSEIAKEIEKVYSLASIPTNNVITICKNIRKLNDMRRKRLKELVSNKNRSGQPMVSGKWKQKAKNGKYVKHLSEMLFELFPAAKENEIPDIEKEFYEDQKGPRQRIIGNLDKKETAKRTRKFKKVERAEELKEIEAVRKKDDEFQSKELESSPDEDNCDSSSDSSSHEPQIKRGKYITKEKYEALAPVLETAERFNLSDNAVAHMVNATKAAAGILDQEGTSEIMIQSQVNKLKNKIRMEKVEESKWRVPIAIGIDERKDATKISVGIGLKGKQRYETKKIENCSVIYWEKDGDEVKPIYVGHVIPVEGSGKSVAQAVYKFFGDRGTDTSQLRVILTDGCAKMTGWKSGAVSRREYSSK